MVIPLALEVVPVTKKPLVAAETGDIHAKVTGTAEAPHFFVERVKRARPFFDELLPLVRAEKPDPNRLGDGNPAMNM